MLNLLRKKKKKKINKVSSFADLGHSCCVSLTVSIRVHTSNPHSLCSAMFGMFIRRKLPKMDIQIA